MTTALTATRAEICAAACADLFIGAGEIMASPMGLMPSIGARLARLTTEPDLLLSDGEAYLLADTPALGGSGAIEGWIPYRKVFDVVASGRRHVIMGANQLDRFGNQNISCIGDHAKPTRQMFGVRGGPGNTINHRTSYWVPKHSTRVFVEAVDMVSGVGYDKVYGNPAGRFLDVHRIVSNLAVLDFAGPSRSMRLVSIHPGVSVEEVCEATGFDLDATDVSETRTPTEHELELIRVDIDPRGSREREVPTP
ncbi:CoA-transferase [Rhodococcus sp. G-MC3]|uniref:CoA-transferase subunit beta n=1 Tax=Rhodococcus sp. G-MC3 TaxID=3046209 RepID=UPI0024B99DA8|nr:CoA-transferase [Rhodococcus sp. G-MC3]MDJ0394143.1 CoA-transferase [Rhodococcus sp. G-MC3]